MIWNRILAVSILVCAVPCLASPPGPTTRNEQVRAYDGEPIAKWHLPGSNLIHERVIASVDISEAGRKVASAKDGSYFIWQDGGKYVVSKKEFTELKSVSAKRAKDLNADGTVIGRCLVAFDSQDLMGLLVTTGIIDANIHIRADVSLMEEGIDKEGRWYRLVSHDPYWTSRKNIAIYDFAVHVGTDGTVRLMHPNHVGTKKAK